MKTFIFFIALLSMSFSFAQNIEVVYSRKYTLTPEHEKFRKYFTAQALKELQKKEYLFLVKSNNSTLFYPVRRPENTKIVDTVRTSEHSIHIYENKFAQEMSIYYINYANNFYLKKYINSFGKKFDIKDSIPKLKWTILRETDKMHGYKTQKATTMYQNMKIIAWFAEDIPISIGPKIFAGLPGLIMKLKMGVATYEVEKIKFLKIPPLITPPKPYGNHYLTNQEYLIISKKNSIKSSITTKDCPTCPDNNK